MTYFSYYNSLFSIKNLVKYNMVLRMVAGLKFPVA